MHLLQFREILNAQNRAIYHKRHQDPHSYDNPSTHGRVEESRSTNLTPLRISISILGRSLMLQKWSDSLYKAPTSTFVRNSIGAWHGHSAPRGAVTYDLTLSLCTTLASASKTMPLSASYSVHVARNFPHSQSCLARFGGVLGYHCCGPERRTCGR